MQKKNIPFLSMFEHATSVYLELSPIIGDYIANVGR